MRCALSVLDHVARGSALGFVVEKPAKSRVERRRVQKQMELMENEWCVCVGWFVGEWDYGAASSQRALH